MDECFLKAWNVVKNSGWFVGEVPENLEGSDVHQAAFMWVDNGLVVDWNDGNVNNQEMSQALFNMWDHYDYETGEKF